MSPVSKVLGARAMVHFAIAAYQLAGTLLLFMPWPGEPQ